MACIILWNSATLKKRSLLSLWRLLIPRICYVKLYKTFGFGHQSSINLYKNPSTKRRTSCLTTRSNIGRSLHPRELRQMHPSAERFFTGCLYVFSDPGALYYYEGTIDPAQRKHITPKISRWSENYWFCCSASQQWP